MVILAKISQSFENVKNVVEDPLTTAKLSFFSYFASHFQPFLEKYQTSRLMIPSLYQDFVKFLRSLLQIVVKDNTLDKLSAGQQLTKMDLGNKETFKTKRKEMHLGLALNLQLTS